MKILLCVILFFSVSAHAKKIKPIYTQYQAEVVRVIDGDTVVLNIHVWPQLIQKIKLRLKGVNTPEKRGKGISDCEKAAAQKATTYTQRFLKGAKFVTVTNVKQGKYAGRALGLISVDGMDLGNSLVKAGHARIYGGGKRKPWCG